MSRKTLRLMVQALVLLIVVWAGVTFFSNREAATAPASGALAELFQGVTPETVSAVKIRPPRGSEVALERQGAGAWTVNGLPADSSEIARLLDGLEGAAIGDLVATNPENHARMGVAGDSAWRVELDVDGATRTVLLGSAGSRYGTTYVRAPGEDPVYLMTGNVRSLLTRGADAWRNKRVAAVDTAAVARIEVAAGDDAYRLQRQDSTWTLEGGGKADAATVRSLLGELASARASGFVAPGDSLAQVPARDRVLALSATGDTLAALTVGGEGGDRWVRARGDETLYRLQSYRADRLAPAEDKVTGSGS